MSEFTQKLQSFSNSTLGVPTTQFLQINASIIIRVLALILFYGIGIAYYNTVEHWTTTDCIYFITVSSTTVGYGHFVPTTDNSRIFTTFYLIAGVLLVVDVLNVLAVQIFDGMQNFILDTLTPSRSIQIRTGKKISLSIFMVLIAIFIGTVFFSVNENWTVAKSYYWVIATMLTVGYGEFPLKESSRAFSIFFILFCVSIYLTALHNITDSWREVHREHKRQQILSSSFSQIELGNMFSALDDEKFSDQDKLNNNSKDRTVNKLDQNQFVLDSLLKLGSIDQQKDIDPLVKSFKAYQESRRQSKDSSSSPRNER